MTEFLSEKLKLLEQQSSLENQYENLKKSLREKGQKVKFSSQYNYLNTAIWRVKQKIKSLPSEAQNLEKNVEENLNQSLEVKKLASLTQRMCLLKENLKLNFTKCRESKEYHTLQKAIYRCKKK